METITHFCKELLFWQGLCRCVRTELTAVCHWFMQPCVVLILNSRTWAAQLWLCTQSGFILGLCWYSVQVFGLDWFFCLCLFFPSLGRWLKSVCVQRALWTRGHPAWQTLGYFASSAMVNDCVWTILTLIHASCTQRGCSQFWQQRFLKPGCTSAHISTADQIHALEDLWACPGHEVTPFWWPG